MALTGDPNGTMSLELYEVQTTDPVHPSMVNPQLQMLVTNDAVLKKRLDVIEAAGVLALPGRVSALEAINAETRLTALEAVNAGTRLDALEAVRANDRLNVLEGAVNTLDGRISDLEAIDADARLDALEQAQGATMVYTSSPPLDAAIGARWLRPFNGTIITLTKARVEGGRNVWVTEPQAISLHAASIGTDAGVSDRWALPGSMFGMTVNRAIATRIRYKYTVQALGVGMDYRARAWWRVPGGASPKGRGSSSGVDPGDEGAPNNTSGATLVLNATASGFQNHLIDHEQGEYTVDSLTPLTPGLQIWVQAWRDTAGWGSDNNIRGNTQVFLDVSFIVELLQ